MVALHHSIRWRGIVQEQLMLLILRNDTLPYNFIVNFEHWAVTYDKSMRYVNIMLFIRCCDQCKIYIYIYIKLFILGEELSVLKVIGWIFNARTPVRNILSKFCHCMNEKVLGWGWICENRKNEFLGGRF